MNKDTERVRYGRVNTKNNVKAPKNTLFTFRDGELIYFGIARCNNVFDAFRKETGKLIAKNRAKTAASEFGVGGVSENQLRASEIDGLELHRSGLRGVVNINEIKALLRYFNNIDDIMLPEYLRQEIINKEL